MPMRRRLQAVKGRSVPEDMDDEASEGLQPPRTELTDKLEQLYNDYPNRIRVDAWRELFVRMHLYRLTQRQKHWRSCLYF